MSLRENMEKTKEKEGRKGQRKKGKEERRKMGVGGRPG